MGASLGHQVIEAPAKPTRFLAKLVASPPAMPRPPYPGTRQVAAETILPTVSEHTFQGKAHSFVLRQSTFIPYPEFGFILVYSHSSSN